MSGGLGTAGASAASASISAASASADQPAAKLSSRNTTMLGVIQSAVKQPVEPVGAQPEPSSVAKAVPCTPKPSTKDPELGVLARARHQVERERARARHLAVVEAQQTSRVARVQQIARLGKRTHRVTDLTDSSQATTSALDQTQQPAVASHAQPDKQDRATI